jgi:preprotein translocase subunit SecB
MPIQLSPFQLEGYYIREFSFAVKPGLEDTARLAMQPGLHLQVDGLFNPDELTVNMRAGGGSDPEDQLRWMAVLEIESENNSEINFPYTFRVVLVGYFRLNVPQPVDDMEKVTAAIKVNATSILYSAARELIASVTGRGPFPAAVLPSVVIRFDIEPKQKRAPSRKKKVQIGRKRTANKPGKKGANKKKVK